ncbi:hypothetical protein ACQKNX_22765 [Lysinibacillus sp. NPDC093712]|uniref:hypothetical protein n=1 Tax=Lysinibacillus sp. NPDC093712 TaxID=3390579 RepID=UPI003D02B0B5
MENHEKLDILNGIEILKNKGYQIVTIDLSSTSTSYYNPFEIGFNKLEDEIEDDINKRLEDKGDF